MGIESHNVVSFTTNRYELKVCYLRRPILNFMFYVVLGILHSQRYRSDM